MNFNCQHCTDTVRHYHENKGKFYVGENQLVPGDRVIINGMGFVDEEGVIMDPLNLPEGWVMEHPHKRFTNYLVKPDRLNLNGFWMPEHLLTRNPFIDPPNTVDELPTLARERLK